MTAGQPSSTLWELWIVDCGDSDTSRELWSDLVKRWSEPHRGYHNLHHLLQVLTVIDSLSSGQEDLQAVRLAAWFHDAIYDPKAADNEAQSAELARAELGTLKLDEALVDDVCELILMTIEHQVEEAEDSARRCALLLHDADLSILGAPAAQYLMYVNGVRREYAHVPDKEFTSARSAILQGFLDRERIFLLDDAHERLEESARTNIAAELLIYSPDEPEEGPSLLGIPLS